MAFQCIERNVKCRHLLLYLILDGKYSINSNLKLLMEDSRKMFGKHSLKVTNTFNSLIDQVVYSAFEQRFSNRFSSLYNNTKADQLLLDSKIEQGGRGTNKDIRSSLFRHLAIPAALRLGSDCIDILNRLINSMLRLVNIFFVLNIENKETHPDIHRWNRNIGTLLANMNFLLDEKYENRWKHVRRQSLIDDDLEKKSTMSNVAKVNLYDEMAELLSELIPVHKVALTDLMGLLGFTDSKKTEDTLYPLLGFDHLFYTPTSHCNLPDYLNSWSQYRDQVDMFSNDEGRRRAMGKNCSNEDDINQLG